MFYRGIVHDRGGGSTKDFLEFIKNSDINLHFFVRHANIFLTPDLRIHPSLGSRSTGDIVLSGPISDEPTLMAYQYKYDAKIMDTKLVVFKDNQFEASVGRGGNESKISIGGMSSTLVIKSKAIIHSTKYLPIEELLTADDERIRKFAIQRNQGD